MQGLGEAPSSPLAFEGALLIVGGGQVEPALLKALAAQASGLIGADSGGDAIVAAGLVPDAVIGDMDSVRDTRRFPARTRILTIAEQDTTDFEKCLYSTSAPVTIAIGMTGGRFDHTLAALHAVARHGRDRWIILVDEHDLALVVGGSVAISVGEGERVSLYPLGRTQFRSSRGLVYRLDGLTLEQGKAIGTSNRATEDIIELVTEPDGAPYLLIVGRDHLAAIVGQLMDGAPR